MPRVITPEALERMRAGGRRGGRSGNGLSKARSPEHYRAAAAVRWGSGRTGTGRRPRTQTATLKELVRLNSERQAAGLELLTMDQFRATLVHTLAHSGEMRDTDSVTARSIDKPEVAQAEPEQRPNPETGS